MKQANRHQGVNSRCGVLGAFVCLALSIASAPAAPFSDWTHRQDLRVPAAGLVKINLPAEILDIAQPTLSDLRIVDPAGAEVAFTIERPAPAAKVVRPPKSFRVAIEDRATVITVETGMAPPIEAISLETPAGAFIKAVRVEGLSSEGAWQVLAEGYPIFRQSGVTQLQVPLPRGVWQSLRLRVSDQRTMPIAFTGARLHAAEPEPVPDEPFPVTIAERVENPGQTRLTLNLGAANLTLAALQFDTADPLFMRRVTLAEKQVLENAIHERALVEDTLFRVEVEGARTDPKLAVPVERQIQSRELVVLIQNDDSPPLQITGISARRRSVRAVFMARQAGVFGLLAGNRLAAAPRYDLSALGADLKHAPVSSLQPAGLAANPLFRAPETLAGVQVVGAALDVAAWKFRKPVRLARPGVLQVELDADVLARAQSGCSDLRLIQDGRQVPYILEHPSITRAIRPEVTLANDPKKPGETRWRIKLPQGNLPVHRFLCESDTPLFQRELTLYEIASDGRGNDYQRPLGRASWTQTPDRKSRQFGLVLSSTPATDTLFLVTDNGDNPPITLTHFQFFHSVTRLLFKAGSAAPVDLYYGNPKTSAPRYDLSLVAGQILSADKIPAELGPQEQLKKSSWTERKIGGKSGVLFWGILGLVVAALLVLIARLLPKSDATPPSAG